MIVDDFIFDGVYASDYGLFICDINASNENVSVGADLSLNTVSVGNGSRWLITDTTYDQAVTTTFQVVKFSCDDKEAIFNGVGLTIEDQRRITRWLMRKEYCMFQPLSSSQEETIDIVYEGTFTSMSEIIIGGVIVGYDLTFTANRPYATSGIMNVKLNSEKAKQVDGNYEWEFIDESDEVGYIYPRKMTITMKESSGDTEQTALVLRNGIEGRETRLWGLSAGEEIVFDENLIVKSNNASHRLENEFNYVYFRIANTYEDRKNIISVNYECDIEFEYMPAVKGVGI